MPQYILVHHVYNHIKHDKQWLV